MIMIMIIQWFTCCKSWNIAVETNGNALRLVNNVLFNQNAKWMHWEWMLHERKYFALFPFLHIYVIYSWGSENDRWVNVTEEVLCPFPTSWRAKIICFLYNCQNQVCGPVEFMLRFCSNWDAVDLWFASLPIFMLTVRCLTHTDSKNRLRGGCGLQWKKQNRAALIFTVTFYSVFPLSCNFPLYVESVVLWWTYLLYLRETEKHTRANLLCSLETLTVRS